MKPNFFIIGAPNSGTTSLWYLLRQHPSIYLPDIKEPRFFSSKDFKNNLETYEDLFKEAKQEHAVGEASVNYSETHIWPKVPRRIANYNSQAKIIYMVRHPLERIESCWKQALSSGHWKKRFYTDKKMPLDFNQAVREYPHMLGTTKYWKHLSAYRDYFSDKQIKLLFFSDFIENPSVQLETCCEFLGVDGTFIFENADTPRNATANKKMERPLIVKIKQLKIIEMVKKVLPDAWKSYLDKNFLSKPVPCEVDWNGETKKWVLIQLKGDIQKILKYGNKPTNYWKFNYDLQSLS